MEVPSDRRVHTQSGVIRTNHTSSHRLTVRSHASEKSGHKNRGTWVKVMFPVDPGESAVFTKPGGTQTCVWLADAASEGLQETKHRLQKTFTVSKVSPANFSLIRGQISSEWLRLLQEGISQWKQWICTSRDKEPNWSDEQKWNLRMNLFLKISLKS